MEYFSVLRIFYYTQNRIGLGYSAEYSPKKRGIESSNNELVMSGEKNQRRTERRLPLDVYSPFCVDFWQFFWNARIHCYGNNTLRPTAVGMAHWLWIRCLLGMNIEGQKARNRLHMRLCVVIYLYSTSALSVPQFSHCAVINFLPQFVIRINGLSPKYPQMKDIMLIVALLDR